LSNYLRILVMGLIGFTPYVLIYFYYASKDKFQWSTGITILVSGLLAGLILTKFKITSPLWLTLLTPVVAMPISAIIMLLINVTMSGSKENVLEAFGGIMIAQNLVFILTPQISIPVLLSAYVALTFINKID
jgi:predicted neutral ceramidase superfamily lipid hydrolase